MALRTATVTWISYNNFGTFLQAYALQHVLIGLGVENKILSDKRFVSNKSFKGFILKFLSFIKLQDKTSNYYKRFKNQFLHIDEKWNYESINKDYDLLLCGSDQIWSPYLPFNSFYYLGFTTKKKIAYAPSTGTGITTEEYIRNVKPLIESFSYLSVREEDGAKMLSSFVSQDIHVVLDPTLLLTSTEWDYVESKIMCSEQYVLCYFLTPNQWYLDYVKDYSKKHNIRIKIFNTHPLYKTTGFDVVEAGPGEFISYIKNASKIFTDSFHSSIFSIIYHKEFITFKRFVDGGEKDQNARIANLFNKLDINDYFIGENNLSTIGCIYKPDYSIVDQKLNKLREKSIDFLRRAIGM